MQKEKILVLDFGSQYAHLIAKRFRLLGYYSEIALPSSDLNQFENVKGIVFSGGPSSIYEENAPEFNQKIMALPVPILGLCYGHYIVTHYSGGKVGKANVGEYGYATLLANENATTCPLFEGIDLPEQVWMSHQDGVLALADGFEAVAHTKDCPYAAVQNLSKKRFGLQFHVEVKDTPCGERIFENFAKFCGMQKNWDQNAILDHIIASIKTQSKGKKVMLFLSGGVDSSVAFALLNNALGQERVLGLHIDNGFMRKDESSLVAQMYKKYGFNNFIVEDASTSFLDAVKGLTDPQKKRMAVGENFITVRDAFVAKQNFKEDEWLLAQGTLYPDIIESGGTKNAHTIKTHHNRVDGIQALIQKGLIIEPLKDLYKDEVRIIGKKLGLDDELVMRHPFPGPGLSINVLCTDGALSIEDAKALENAKNELNNFDLSCFFANVHKRNVLPVKSVGVQGDFRTYRYPAVLHFAKPNTVCTFDNLPSWDKLEEASSFITNSSKEINRTVLALFEKENCTLQKGYCTKKRLDQTRVVDAIVLSSLRKYDWYNKIFQHLTIHLPYATNEEHCAIVLRPVVSEDVMTARFAKLQKELFDEIVQTITKLDFVDALYYDITNKPPATFGWE